MEVVDIIYGHLVYCNWYILWPFGIFYGRLVYFMAVWYFFPFWYVEARKIWQPRPVVALLAHWLQVDLVELGLDRHLLVAGGAGKVVDAPGVNVIELLFGA
jgi:hypothetical protein